MAGGSVKYVGRLKNAECKSCKEAREERRRRALETSLTDFRVATVISGLLTTLGIYPQKPEALGRGLELIDARAVENVVILSRSRLDAIYDPSLGEFRDPTSTEVSIYALLESQRAPD